MEYDLRKATGRRIVHHEEDALDRRLVGEPPLLGLEVVAGAALLVFGHRFVLGLLRRRFVWLALCRSWLFLSRGDGASCGFCSVGDRGRWVEDSCAVAKAERQKCGRMNCFLAARQNLKN